MIIAGFYSRHGASYALLRAPLTGKLPFAISPLLSLKYDGILDKKIRDSLLKISYNDGRIIFDLEGKPMKTSVTLRLPEELKTKIKEEAEHNDMSVNQFILYTLTKEVSQKEAISVLKTHIKNAPSRKQALSLLDSIIPNIQPLKGDEIL